MAPFAFDPVIAVRTSVSVRPYEASARVSTWMRTAGRCPPESVTRPTPFTWLIFKASRVFAMFCTSVSGKVSDVIASDSTGASAGFTFAYTGGAGRSAGNSDAPALIAACTCCSAMSSARPRLNCKVTIDTPAALVELMRARPGIWPNCRSSGAVTVCAITSGLPPGYSVCTWIVG